MDYQRLVYGKLPSGTFLTLSFFLNGSNYRLHYEIAYLVKVVDSPFAPVVFQDDLGLVVLPNIPNGRKLVCLTASLTCVFLIETEDL